MRRMRTAVLGGLAVAFAIGSIAALVMGRTTGAVFLAVMAVVSAIVAVPKRPRTGGLQLRDVMPFTLVVLGFTAYLITDLIRAVADGQLLTQRVGMDTPMLVICLPFGYLAVRTSIALARGANLPDPRLNRSRRLQQLGPARADNPERPAS